MAGLAVQNFLSAAVGICVLIVLMRGIASRPLGNFFEDLTRVVLRILLPISFVGALVLTVLVPAVALYRVLRVRRAFSTAAEQATYNVLHKANEAAPPFRAGLTRAAPPRGSSLHPVNTTRSATRANSP